MVTMAAALETEYYEPNDIYNCGLEFTELPGITLYDWRYEKELSAAGELTLIGGLEKSCNPWFYHIGLDLYIKNLPACLRPCKAGGNTHFILFSSSLRNKFRRAKVSIQVLA